MAPEPIADRTSDSVPCPSCGSGTRIPLLLIIVSASLLVRALLAARLDIFGDEAIYWWQGHMSVTFCPHPPVVPWMVLLGERLIGHGTLGLRLSSLVWGTASVLLAYLLGRDLFNRRAGLWAASLFAAAPFFLAIGAIATPDIPLVFLWLLFTWTAWHAAQKDRMLWWLATALVLAAGLYSKYMMVLSAPALLVALAATPRGRLVLRRPGPWLALLIGCALFVPVFLFWNWHHGWSTIRYHLANRHEWTLSVLKQAGVYLAGHAAVYSPVLFVAMLLALGVMWRAWRRGRPEAAWLLAFSAVPIVFFLVPNLFTQAELSRVQWDEIGYAVAAVAVGGAIASDGLVKRARAWLRLGQVSLGVALVLSIVLAALALWPGLAGSLGVQPPTHQLIGWREMARHVRQIEDTWPGERPILVGGSFKEAVCLGYHLERVHDIYALSAGRNETYGLVNQMALWKIDEAHMLKEARGRDALCVFQQEPDPDAPRPSKRSLIRMARRFTFTEPLDTLDIFAGPRLVWTFYFHRCRDMIPLSSPAPQAVDELH